MSKNKKNKFYGVNDDLWGHKWGFKDSSFIINDDNTVTFDGDGYAGQYFKLEQTGGSRTFNISQQSTLDNDWLRIISNGSNGTVCVNQDDQGTSTSC